MSGRSRLIGMRIGGFFWGRRRGRSGRIDLEMLAKMVAKIMGIVGARDCGVRRKSEVMMAMEKEIKMKITPGFNFIKKKIKKKMKMTSPRVTFAMKNTTSKNRTNPHQNTKKSSATKKSKNSKPKKSKNSKPPAPKSQ